MFVRSGGRLWDPMILQSKHLYACCDAHRTQKEVGLLEKCQNCRKIRVITNHKLVTFQSGYFEYGTGSLAVFFFLKKKQD